MSDQPQNEVDRDAAGRGDQQIDLGTRSFQPRQLVRQLQDQPQSEVDLAGASSEENVRSTSERGRIPVAIYYLRNLSDQPRSEVDPERNGT